MQYYLKTLHKKMFRKSKGKSPTGKKRANNKKQTKNPGEKIMQTKLNSQKEQFYMTEYMSIFIWKNFEPFKRYNLRPNPLIY